MSITTFAASLLPCMKPTTAYPLYASKSMTRYSDFPMERCFIGPTKLEHMHCKIFAAVRFSLEDTALSGECSDLLTHKCRNR